MTRPTRNLGSIGLALLLAGGVIAIAADPAATTAPATTRGTAASTAPATAPVTTALVASTGPATTPSAAKTATPTPAPSATATRPPAPAVSSTATPSARSTSRESYRDRYDVLADRNIFVKERWKIVRQSDIGRTPRNPNPSRDVVRVAPPPEASYILTGIVLPEAGEDDGQVHAIVEDMKAGKILRLSVGDAVARGQITDMSIDAVQYSANGQQVWVDLGRDFTGAIPASPSAIYAAAAAGGSPTTAGSTTGPTSAPSVALPLDPNNPNLSLEERMKIRRMQQLGGQNK